MPPSALAILLGLGAALCFGTGDYLAQRLTHRHGWLVAALGVQLVALVMLGVLALLWHGPPPAASARAWGLVGLIGVVNTLALIALYRAFEAGKLSLISPIVGSMGAFSVLFVWVDGYRPPPAMLPGLVAIVVGIVIASVVVDSEEEEAVQTQTQAPAKLRQAKGVGWALLSAVAFGWVFFMLGPSSEELGSAWVVCGLRLVAIVGLVPLAALLRKRAGNELVELGRASWSRLLIVALFDCGGMFTFAHASSLPAIGDHIAVLMVLTSCFPVITIAWAQLHLREVLRWWQWVGVTLVIASIVWITVFERLS